MHHPPPPKEGCVIFGMLRDVVLHPETLALDPEPKKMRAQGCVFSTLGIPGLLLSPNP